MIGNCILLVCTVSSIARLISGSYVYISNYDDGTIDIFQLSTGSLSKVATERVGANMDVLLPNSLRTRLYASAYPNLYTYAIAARGNLTLESMVALAGDETTHMALDKSDRFLFRAIYNEGVEHTNSFLSTGILNSTDLQSIPLGRNPHMVALDHTNHFAFIPCLGSDQIYQFRLSSNGLLTPNTPATLVLPNNTGPRHLVLAPNNRFAYVLGEVSGEISAFALSSTGTLTSMGSPVSILPPGSKLVRRTLGQTHEAKHVWAAEIHITANGKFLYASERSNSTLTKFLVNNVTGVLSSPAFVHTERQPRSFAIDPSDSYLVAVGELSTQLSLYSLDPALGTLSLMSRHDVGKGARWVEIVSQATLPDCLGPILAASLITKTSANYSFYSAEENRRLKRSPYGILLVESDVQVVTAVNCARELGITPVPRCGGHSYEQYSALDNSLVIDLRRLNRVTVLPSSLSHPPRAVVQGGAMLGHVYTELWNQGNYSFNAGNCPSVGIGGHLSGGGKGYQSRQYGLAADQVVEMSVVLADGRIVTANSRSHPDLFWSLRGGGAGSFGVVLSYTINVFTLPVENGVFYLEFPLSVMVLDIFQRSFVTTAPTELTCQLTLVQNQIQLNGHFIGSQASLQAFLESTSLLLLASKRIVTSCSGLGMRSFTWYEGQNSCDNLRVVIHPTRLEESFKAKSDYIDSYLPLQALQTIIDHIKILSSFGYLQLTTMGGMIDTIGAIDPTPFDGRNTLLSLQYSVYMTGQSAGSSAQETSYRWINELEKILYPYVTGRHYQNYCDSDLVDYGVGYYGEANFRRLIGVKRVYDPLDLWSNPQSIPLNYSSVVASPLKAPTKAVEDDDVASNIGAIVGAAFVVLIAGIFLTSYLLFNYKKDREEKASGK